MSERYDPGTKNAAKTAQTNSGPHVLIVDEHRVHRSTLAAYCDLFDHRWTTVASAGEALAAMQTGQVEVVLIDVNIDGGFELVRALRAMRGRAAVTPIIAVMDRRAPAEVERCLAAGLSAVVSKPVTAAKLFAAIGSALSDSPREPRSWAPAA
ncbi:MAG: response regulator [Caulobacterales bacterium]